VRPGGRTAEQAMVLLEGPPLAVQAAAVEARLGCGEADADPLAGVVVDSCLRQQVAVPRVREERDRTRSTKSCRSGIPPKCLGSS